MKIDAPKIKSWVERIEALLEERAALNGDIRDIFVEVKKGDHDAKAIRKLIQRRAQDAGDLAQQDALLEAYTDAVAGKIKALEAIAKGATTKEAAKAAGISTGSVSALVSVQKSRSLNAAEVQEVAHDPATGEVIRINPGEGEDGTAKPVGQSSPPEAPEERGNAKPSRDGEASADERDASASSSPPNEHTTGAAHDQSQEGFIPSAGQKGSVDRPERDAGNAEAGPIGSGGLGAGQDDGREDGGRVCGERAPEDELTRSREADLSAVDAGRLGPPSDPAVESVAVNPDPLPERASLVIGNGQGTHPGTLSESCGGVEGHAGRLLAPNCESGGDEQRRSDETHKDRKTAGTPAMAASGTAGIKPGPQDSIWDELEATRRDIEAALIRRSATVQP